MIGKFMLDIIRIIFYINMIIMIPVIGLQCYLSLSTGRKYTAYRMRNHYLKWIISLNVNLALCFIKILKIFFIAMVEGIKNSKAFLLKVYYYQNEMEKLSFDKFCKGIESLTSSEFEEFTANLYSGLGYKVKLMPPGPDGGKDVILKDDNGFIYVECKHYLKGMVGREICQKLIGAAIGDNIKRTIIFTCGKIHKNAYEYVEKINDSYNEVKLEIIDIEKMYNLYIKSKVTNQALKLIS